MNIKLRDYGINFVAVIISYVLLQVLLKSGLVNGYIEGVVAFAFINIIVAISLNIAAGFMGQMALGHAGFMAIGAYSAALFAKAVDFPEIAELLLGMMIGGIVAGIFGLVIGIPALRLRGDYLGIVTLGFGEMIRYTIINLKDITGGASGLKRIPILLDIYSIYIILAVVVAFAFLFIRSRHGRAIISIREDEIAAESIGIPTTFYKVYGFFISSFIAGVGGACYAFYQGYLSPENFKFMFSVELFIIVVFGGMGSITGTIVAGLFLAALTQFLYSLSSFGGISDTVAQLVSDSRLIIYALLLIVMMIFKPDGILGRAEFSLVRTPARIKALFIKSQKTLEKE